MAASASEHAARERKQKIFVAVGGVVLLLILAIQLPKLLGGSESTATGTTTTVAGETTSTTGTTTTPTGVPTPTSVSIALTDTDRPLPVGPGQFRSFSAFDRKDPFVQKIKTPGSSPSGSEDSGGGTGGGSSNGGDSKPPAKEELPSRGFNVDGTPSAAVTVISVNGVRQALEPGGAFPAADPVFVLVAENPGAKTAVIGVRGGAYANGARTTKLKIGKPLVLVNTTTGARYRVVLVAVGTGAGSSSGSGSPATPSGPTTP
jgi:hypothetical protein